MKTTYPVLRWFTCAFAFSVSAFAGAQTAPQTAAVNPSAPVPPVVYRSVFTGTPTGVETQTTDWKKANATVGEFKRGHIDLLKWENMQPQDAGEAAPDAARPDVPDVHKH